MANFSIHDISRAAAVELPVTVIRELLSTSNSRCTCTSLPTNPATVTPANRPPASAATREKLPDTLST
ncbi:hypothetical protein D3C71_2215180 [compost metagenome]